MDSMNPYTFPLRTKLHGQKYVDGHGRTLKVQEGIPETESLFRSRQMEGVACHATGGGVTPLQKRPRSKISIIKSAQSELISALLKRLYGPQTAER